jgi:hypothetical protein
MSLDGKIYLDFSEDIRALLEGQGIRVQDILTEQHIDAEVCFEPLPLEHPGERTRDLVPVILAGSFAAVSVAAAVAIVTAAIAKFLDRQAARPRYVEYFEPRLVLDGQGNPILDGQGNVQTVRVPVRTFVEPKNLSVESFTFDGSLKNVVVKLESKPLPRGVAGTK